MAKYERVNLRVLASPTSYINLGFNITSPITGATGWTVNYKSGFTASASIADISERFYPNPTGDVGWIDHPDVVKDGNRNGSTTNWAIIEVGNLDNTKTYTFEIFCTSTDLLYETEVEVGSESPQIMTAGLMQGNANDLLTFSGVSPSSGVIELRYKRPAGSAYSNAVINAFRVVEEDHPDVVVETYTVAPSGGDYTSLTAFQTAQVQNLVANNKRIEVTVSGDLAGSFSMSSSWVTDPDHYVLFKAASGSEAISHCSISGGVLTVASGAARLTASNFWGTSFIFSTDYTHVKDLYFSNTNTNGYVSAFASGWNSILENCIAITVTNNTSGNVRGIRTSGGRLYKCISSMTGSTDEPAIEATGDYSFILNCLAHGSPIGIAGFDNTINLERSVIQNCVSYDCTTDYEFTNTAESDSTLPVAFVGSRNNAGGTATAANIPGTNSVVSITSADFETNSVLCKAGEKLDNAGYAHFQFILDILGNSITGAWSIGVNDPVSVVEVTASGAYTSGASLLSGSATRTVDALATFLSGTSALAGSATNVLEITSAASFTSSTSTLASSATREITSTAELNSSSASLDGAAERQVDASASLVSTNSSVSGITSRELSSAGALASQDASMSAQAGRGVEASASLESNDASLTGSATRTITSTASVSSSDSTLSGQIVREITAESALNSTASSLLGLASRVITTDASLVSSPSSLVGSTTASAEFTASGSLGSSLATITSSVTRVVTSFGNLASDNSILSGQTTRVVVSDSELVSSTADLNAFASREISSGAELESQAGQLDSVASRQVTSDGDLSSGNSSITGVSTRLITTTSNLDSQPSQLEAGATRVVTSSATLESQDSDIDALVTFAGVVVATGALQSQSSSLSGLSTRIVNSQAAYSALDSSLVGSATRVLDAFGSYVSASAVLFSSALREVVSNGSLVSSNSVLEAIATTGLTVTLSSDFSTLEATATVIKTVTASFVSEQSILNSEATVVVPVIATPLQLFTPTVEADKFTANLANKFVAQVSDTLFKASTADRVFLAESLQSRFSTNLSG